MNKINYIQYISLKNISLFFSEHFSHIVIEFSLSIFYVNLRKLESCLLHDVIRL